MFCTEIEYTVLTSSLSASASLLLIPLLSRSGRRRDFFSAALGIIAFTVAKSIIVDCGWEFAALCGNAGGVLAEISIMCAGILFFSEMRKESSRTTYSLRFHSVAGAALTAAGKMLLCDVALMPEPGVHIVLDAFRILLPVCAVNAVGNAGAFTEVRSGALFIVSVFASAAALTLLAGGSTALAAPVITALGSCELAVGFVEETGRDEEISAPGFAAGMMLAYGAEYISI